MRYAPEWAPDGKRIAFGDKDGKVLHPDGRRQEVIEIADSPRGQIRDYTWSPRGNHLAFSMANEPASVRSTFGARAMASFVESPTNGSTPTIRPGTRRETISTILSDREFAPQISSIEFNYATNRSTGIFALALRKDVKNPFPPESDEVTITKDDVGPAQGAGEEGTPRPNRPRTWRSISTASARVWREFRSRRTTTAALRRRPVIFFTQSGLRSTTDGRVIGRRRCASTRSRIARRRRSSTTFAATCFRTMVRRCWCGRDGSFNIYDATPQGERVARRRFRPPDSRSIACPPKSGTRSSTKCGGVIATCSTFPTCTATIGRRLREQYRPLLKYVAHRSDLNYVIGEMISELTVQHAYVEGGDFQIPPRPRVGSAGRRFELDQKAGRFKIAQDLRGPE